MKSINSPEPTLFFHGPITNTSPPYRYALNRTYNNRGNPSSQDHEQKIPRMNISQQ